MSAQLLAARRPHNRTRVEPWRENGVQGEQANLANVEWFSHYHRPNEQASAPQGNFPLVRESRALRIVRLPISLRRKEVVDAIWSVLRKCELDWSVDRLEVIQLNDGRRHVKVLGANDAVRRALTPWVEAQHARIKWHVDGPPSVRRPGAPTAHQNRPHKVSQVKLASWNVNSFGSKRWEVRESFRKYNWGIVGMQETMLKEGDWPLSIAGYQVFERAYNDDVPGARGLAIAVSRRFTSHMVDCTDHWMLVKVHGMEPDKPWHIFNVYIPHDREQKSKVIRSLRQRVLRVQNHDPNSRIVVLGDLNCRASRADTLFPRNVGMERIRVAGSDKTFHRRKKWSGIDHILASNLTAPLLGRAKVKRRCDVSDHFPIVTKVRVRLQQRKAQLASNRIDRVALGAVREKIVNDGFWERWWASCQSEADAEELNGKEWLDDAATRWDITSWRVAEKHGAVVVPTPPKFKLISRQVKRAVTDKRQAWKAYLRGAEAELDQLWLDYKVARKHFKKTLNAFSAQQWIKCIKRGTQAIQTGQARQFFRWADSIIKYKGNMNLTSSPIADDEGVVHYEPAKIAELWAEHYEKLFSGDENNNKGMEYWEENGGLVHLPPMEGLDDEPTWLEIQTTLLKLKRAKAAGPSGLPAEWFKTMLDEPDEDERPQEPTSPMQKIFHLILLRMWRFSHVPDKWGVAELISIGKKGDLTVRNNYRGISLIEVIVKIIVKLLASRITEQLEANGRLTREQAGFRRHEECMGQTVSLLEVVHRRQTRGQGTILLFIDFKKAYDMVDHDALLYKLKCVGVTERALSFLRALYSSSSTKVRVGQERSRVIRLEKGCRQGCPGSPQFFDVFIDDLPVELRETAVEVPGVDGGLASLLFADDVVDLSDSVPMLKRACEIIDAWSNKWGMHIGIVKCGLMVVGNEDLKREVEMNYDTIRLQGQEIPWVESYDYLGIKLAADGLPAVNEHMVDRAQRFTMRWQRLQPFLRNHSIPIQMRRHIFNTVCLPVLRWGSELMGPSRAAISDLTMAYHQALKGMVGSRSKNTIYSVLTVRRELDVPSFHEMVAVSRARAIKKFPTLNTWAAVLMENQFATRKQGWIKASTAWLKKYPKTDPLTEDAATVRGKIKQYFRQLEEKNEGQTQSFHQYEENRFEDTRAYLKSAVSFPKYSRGVTWLLRARVRGIWSAKRAAKMKLINEAWTELCPACEEVILVDEIVHIMLFCPKYMAQRRSLEQDMAAVLDTVLAPELKVVLMFGGSVEDEDANGPNLPPWTCRQWAGEDREVVEGLGKPGFLPVAKFLQQVMPGHMGSLWAKRQ
jgi:Exonuclease III